jgi:hypothetical protein
MRESSSMDVEVSIGIGWQRRLSHRKNSRFPPGLAHA